MQQPSNQLYKRDPAASISGLARDGHGVQRVAASSFFGTPEQVKADTDLKYAQDPQERPDGMIFLGVGDEADVIAEPDEYGRTRYYVLKGRPVGYADDRHVVTVAGSRGGKSRAVLLGNLANYPGSMVVIDPKGDLARQTASIRREKHGQRTFIFDPFGVTGESKSARYNPVAGLIDSPRIQEDAGLIADALIAETDGDRDRHWDETAKQFLIGVILLVATHPDYEKEGRNLPTVAKVIRHAMAQDWEEVLDDDDAEEGGDGREKQPRRQTYCVLERRMRDAPGPAGPAIAYAGSSFYEKSDRERDTVLSTLRRHVQFITYGSMTEVLTGTSEGFDLSTLRREGSQATVYLTLPAMRMGTCRGWLRLFVNQTLNAMEGATVPAAELAKDRVLMVLDEFAVLGRMRELEAAAGQIAGFGVKLHIVLQDLTQLQALYGKRWESFLANAGILQFFANNDLTTLDWISKRCGQTTVARQNNATPGVQARNEGANQGDSEANGVLLPVEEAARVLDRDGPHQRQLVILPGRPPLLLKRVYFDKFDGFKDMRKLGEMS